VGTGPSATSLISVLISRGFRPTVFESASQTDSATRRLLGEEVDSLGYKTWHGSSAMYQAHPAALLSYDKNLRVRASNYLGGFSRVWGATFHPFSEYARWPRNCIPTQQDWAVVESLVPRTATAGMEHENGLLPQLAMNSGLRTMQENLSRRQDYKTQASTLAIDRGASSARRCTLIGECLKGCPHDSIWWAGQQILEWERNGYITLKWDSWLHSFKELSTDVSLTLMDNHGRANTATAQRLFIAAGPLSTAAIAIRSGVSNDVTIHDCMTAFTGMFAVRRLGNPPLKHHNLSHLWIERKMGSKFLIQAYPPDSFHTERLYGRFPHVPRRLIEVINRRLFPLIAYLDGDHSGSLSAQKVGERVAIGIRSAGDRNLMLDQLSIFARHAIRSGFVIPTRASDIGPPGTGNHIGASFPHGSGSDELGRPVGLKRTHFVDASVLPSLEVGSITPTIMANAARIARQTMDGHPQ